MNTNSYSDELLLQRFIDGEPKCFDELVAKYQSTVFSLCINLLGDTVSVSSIVSDIFVELSRRVKQCQSVPFETLVHRVTYDLALSKMMFDFLPSTKNTQCDADNFVKHIESSTGKENGSGYWLSLCEVETNKFELDEIKEMKAVCYTISANNIDVDNEINPDLS